MQNTDGHRGRSRRGIVAKEHTSFPFHLTLIGSGSCHCRVGKSFNLFGVRFVQESKRPTSNSINDAELQPTNFAPTPRTEPSSL